MNAIEQCFEIERNELACDHILRTIAKYQERLAYFAAKVYGPSWVLDWAAEEVARIPGVIADWIAMYNKYSPRAYRAS